jgi:GNAT superfamily N-acetyltransferase
MTAAEPLQLTPSPAESARFGLRVCRLRLGPVSDLDVDVLRHALDEQQPELVIVRYPASEVRMFAALLDLEGYVALYADSLTYWRWDAGSSVPVAAAIELRPTADPAEIGTLVRSIFEGYGNHYMSNPLLDPSGSLEGYVEWATTSLANASTAFVGVERGARAVGFVLVDWGEDPPNIQLAGILPDERGHGRYRHLIEATMAEAVARGFGALQISTQVHNRAVIGTWSRLGWRPADTFTTVHLVKRPAAHTEDSTTRCV